MSTAILCGATVVAADPRTDPHWHARGDGGRLPVHFAALDQIGVRDTTGSPQARIVTDAAGRPTDGFAVPSVTSAVTGWWSPAWTGPSHCGRSATWSRWRTTLRTTHSRSLPDAGCR